MNNIQRPASHRAPSAMHIKSNPSHQQFQFPNNHNQNIIYSPSNPNYLSNQNIQNQLFKQINKLQTNKQQLRSQMFNNQQHLLNNDPSPNYLHKQIEQYQNINQQHPQLPKQSLLQKQKQNLNQHKTIRNYSFNTSDSIGQGFSSIVYKGINDITGQNVAIKVINTLKISNPFQDQMLFNEIDILKKIKSPYLLECYDVFQSANNTYIITEYCDQGDLSKHIKKNGYFQESHAIDIFYQILSGYRELAKYSVIHRDLKPANIFINQGIAKIADFGLAKPSNQMQQAYTCGTPLYMSPEAIKQNVHSTKSDIWALGCIFFEMLYGRPVFNGRDKRQLSDQICNQQVQFPKDIRVSSEAINLIKHCLIMNPELRIGLKEIENHPLIQRHVQMKANEIYQQEMIENEQFQKWRGNIIYQQQNEQNEQKDKENMNPNKVDRKSRSSEQFSMNFKNIGQQQIYKKKEEARPVTIYYKQRREYEVNRIQRSVSSKEASFFQ